ncbi:nuclear pore complex protein Nup155-like [Actinia tenebrosa]|uniref:Nuclear pore complex protein Nup155 n=1 Tax=Actinia tenebrosa TaxID=6105 RepID=A0A6P8IIY0_ACTTE|nr:nuclear pore complex protein Nup155-like [Actinia tenebrosa]
MPAVSGNSSISPSIAVESLENAAKEVDRQLQADRQYPDLAEQLRISSGGGVSFSGVNDYDYPSLSSPSVGLAGMELLSTIKRIPLPAELVEQFDHMQCNCMMGLFPEIRRAWLTIDSDIFVWNYEDGSDLAYFDGLSETILCAGLTKPKPEILAESVKYILCLTTPVDIVLLAVTFTPKSRGGLPDDGFAEMHLQPDPLFSIPSDNVYMTCVTGTFYGRVFAGGKDGCLYEIAYQAEDSWFQRKCRKINHSSSTLSFLVPSFLNVSGEDALCQLAVDNTRNILYTRSEKGTIQVYDLGSNGKETRYVASLNQETISHKAAVATRTSDYSNFKPIVHIAPVSRNESDHLHLVGVTHAGVRLYFSTMPFRNPLERPNRLNLVHVRMPPGFAPSAASVRPTNVHASFYRQGISLLASSRTEDTDVLWVTSANPFPFQTPLKEMQVTLPLDGRTWAVSEVPDFAANLISPCPVLFEKWPEPPIVVKQHALPQRSFVLLSAKGSYLMSSYRPVEQLQQLLISSQGFDSEAVQAFFKLHKENQACAICLVLACSTQSTNQQVSEWATRAFFKYGGESQHSITGAMATDGGVDPSFNMGSPLSGGVHAGSYLGTPATRQGQNGTQPFGQSYSTSTPHPGMTGGAVFQPDFNKSAKHDGICLYIARILGTLWDGKLVYEEFATQPTSGNTKPPVIFKSRFTCEQLAWFLDKMKELQCWMENNLQFVAPYVDSSFPHMSIMGDQSLLQQSHQESFVAERKALSNLKNLVDRSCEAVGLWQLLCEHDISAVTSRMDTAPRDRLRRLRFRDLVTAGQEVCSGLISSLMNCFLDDSSSTDAISERLREISPSLYSDSDAICTKAGELLTLAKKTTNKSEQSRLLKEALQCYRQVTHQVNLELICSIFESVHFFEGVVELCLYAALKKDPQGLALHFYRNSEAPGDVQGQEAMIARKYCYKCLTDCFQRLLAVRLSPHQSPSLPSRPGPPPAPDPNELTPEDADRYLEHTLSLSLSSSDELWHLCLYQWLIDNALTERLLEIKSSYLETYLKQSAANQHPNEQKILDLLWRYYEKTKNYSAAARVLSKLAEKEGPGINLEQRLEYLSRAIMSAKSSNLRTSTSSEGEFLHELEEKLEVARIQLQVYHTLSRMNKSRQTRNIEEALVELNGRLMDVTTLYGDFADVFMLAECKLAIVHCAGHYDPTLIETLWREIIDKELRDSAHCSPSDRITIISKKIVTLGKTYVHSERYFPLGAIILMLEKKSAELDWDPTWVFMSMLEIGIPFPVLHGVYDRLFKAKDPCWQAIDKPLHILDVLYHLLSRFVELPSLIAPYDRPAFTTALHDACATYLVELESICSRDRTVQTTLAKFKALQSRLKRML